VSHAASPAAGAHGSAPARAVPQPSWPAPSGPAGLSFTVRIQRRDGSYAGAIEQLPGCSADGLTLDALLLGLVTAIAQHADVQREIGDLASAPNLAEISRLELFVPRFA
jgi:predicted RNase H-like HicB family nuclease